MTKLSSVLGILPNGTTCFIEHERDGKRCVTELKLERRLLYQHRCKLSDVHGTSDEALLLEHNITLQDLVASIEFDDDTTYITLL